MKTFKFYLDSKVTTWKRTNFEIDAESEEEAKEKAIQFHKENKTADIDWEDIVHISAEPMYPSDNDGQETEVITFASTGNEFWDNVNY